MNDWMSDRYHNWERLAKAVKKRVDYLELTRAFSASFSSTATDSTANSSLSLTEGDASPGVSLSFQSDDESDLVWERLLPPDYLDILARSDTPLVYSSKRELYFHLCDSPILLDGGKLSFSLSEPSGKKCFMLSAMELAIVRGSTPVCWQWKNIAESRFAEVPQLLEVWWLQFHGRMQTRMLSVNTNYAALLVFKIHDERSFGLDSSAKAFVEPVKTHEVIVMAPDNANMVYLQRPKMSRRGGDDVQNMDANMPNLRRDGWMEIELGEYFVNEGDGGDIFMCFWMSELHWKGGLIIEGIELRPKA